MSDLDKKKIRLLVQLIIFLGLLILLRLSEMAFDPSSAIVGMVLGGVVSSISRTVYLIFKVPNKENNKTQPKKT